MAHLVSEAQLVYGCCGISAADDGGGVGFSQGFCHGDGSGCQGGILKYAHGSVPHNGLGGLGRLGVQLGALGSDVQAHHVCRDLVRGYVLYVNGSVNGVREGSGYSRVYGKQQLLAQLLSLLNHLLAVVQLGVVHQRFSYLFALSLQEGESHAAADDQGIAFLQQVGDYVQLVGNLGSAQDGNEGTHRILNSVAEERDLLLHQIAYHTGIHELGHAYVGAVGTMSGTESVVYKYIAEGSQLFGECLSVLGLLRAVAGVLQQDAVAVLHSLYGSFGVGAYHFRISGKFYFLSQQLA